MNLKIILAMALLVIGAAVGFTSFKKSVTPYISFAEARTAQGTVQVNGVLADKNYVARRDEQYLEFKLRDEKNEVLSVIYRGVIPGNFDQATNIVAIGRYQGNRFEAEQLLVKCPSKYQTMSEQGADPSRHPGSKSAPEGTP
jgi:cytochrome c-type biogenesis protein CcmE